MKLQAVIASVVMLLCWANPGDISDDIAAAFRKGDAKGLAKYMGEQVDLVILEKEEVYSRSQAELILKDFFTKNLPKSFNVVHNGVSKNGSKFAIGKLVTGKGSFKVTWFIKKENNVFYIHQLRIEKEEE
ncbi:MAG: DUF4783 domain-containing protein [Bacteroidia bacterium]|nr:DUF4783 domain-containing protein [Bacteroidia bacterium]